ncbi:hypothetical protein TNCV_855191, partial [Trichonephila clavipes]
MESSDLGIVVMVTDSWPVCYEFKPSITEDPPCRGGGRCTRPKRLPVGAVWNLMLGMTKVVFSILLSGMMAIGRTLESRRRGYGASSGWKVFEFFGLAT